jgi:hypothetical protein
MQKQAMPGLPYVKIYFLKYHSRKKVLKKLDFSPKHYFAVLLFKVSAWLSNQAACEIGLKIKKIKKGN